VIADAVDAVNATADAKQIALTVSLAPDLGTMVVDATRIQQVIWNLLTNAVKFTPSGGAVVVSAQRHATTVDISVTDNGEGIDPQFLSHVFEPFRQAESPQTRVHGGLGLGLSIVRFIAEAHGGNVAVQSEGRGKGATFTVTLPVLATARDTEAVKSAMGGDTFLHGVRLTGLDIVIVDDDDESRRMITAVLRASGANIASFDNAAGALEAIAQKEPDLVITDIAMPELDGYGLERAMAERGQRPRVKVVALSAFPAPADRKERFDLYLSKPIDPFRLVDEVAGVLLKTE
jgi:CheY-like chemotaxis protein/anti-sigma regulatory factor (Ser/Thr protein kinase)